MKLTTYLNFGGNCEEAFRFYAEQLGGKVTFTMRFSELPDNGGQPAEKANLILHSTLELGETILQASDTPGGQWQPMRSAYLALRTDSDAEAERTFAVLSPGGEIFMVMQETFFATRFAQLRDRFGINWMILHQREAPNQN
jgi:PhnB protein